MTKYIYEEKIAPSAPICIFQDGADTMPTKSVKVTIPAIVDGISSVSETRMGRNIADVSTATKESEQKCSYVFQNGGLTITATGTYARIGFAIPCIQGATYTLSYKGSSDAQYKRVLIYPNELWSSASYSQTLTETETAYSTTFTTQSNYIYLGFYLTTTGSTGTETIKDIQIELGSTAHDYEPYQTPTQYAANLGRTVYGAEVDLVNGTGISKCVRVKFSDLNWTYYTSGTNPIFYANNVPNMLTYSRAVIPNISIDGYTVRSANSRSSLATNMADMECSAIETAQTIAFRNTSYTSKDAMLAALGDEYISYEVDDESYTDFTFDGQEIDTQLGFNAFWSDSGDTEVTYYTQIPAEERYIIGGNILTNIANAIREKSEKDNPILVEDMASEILNIPVGGGHLKLNEGRVTVSTGAIDTTQTDYYYTDYFDCPSGSVKFDLGETNSNIGLSIYNASGTFVNYWTANSRHRTVDNSSLYHEGYLARISFKKSYLQYVFLMDFAAGEIYSSLSPNTLESQ